jgi:hypothetical protein
VCCAYKFVTYRIYSQYCTSALFIISCIGFCFCLSKKIVAYKSTEAWVQKKEVGNMELKRHSKREYLSTWHYKPVWHRVSNFLGYMNLVLWASGRTSSTGDGSHTACTYTSQHKHKWTREVVCVYNVTRCIYATIVAVEK